MHRTAGSKSDNSGSFSHLNSQSIDKTLQQYLKIQKCQTQSEIDMKKDSGCQTNFREITDAVNKIIKYKMKNVLRNDYAQQDVSDDEDVDVNKKFIIVNISNTNKIDSNVNEYFNSIQENEVV
jgi:hypothetical protein